MASGLASATFTTLSKVLILHVPLFLQNEDTRDYLTELLQRWNEVKMS